MKTLFVLVMCTVAGAASARGASNAFDAWKLPPSVNQDALDRALELSRNLEVGRQVPRAELEAALEARETLDALVTVMREGARGEDMHVALRSLAGPGLRARPRPSQLHALRLLALHRWAPRRAAPDSPAVTAPGQRHAEDAR